MRLHHCYIAVNKASKSEAVTPVPPHSSSSTFASHHVLISHDFCLLLFLFVFHNMISQLFINTSSHVLSTDASVERGLIASMRVINCLGDEFMTTKLLPPPQQARESLSDAMRREKLIAKRFRCVDENSIDANRNIESVTFNLRKVHHRRRATARSHQPEAEIIVLLNILN